jgi:hypothetical protein
MEYTSYQALAAYDLAQCRQAGVPTPDGMVLVLDLDRCGGALCRWAGDTVEQIGATTPKEGAGFFAQLATQTGQTEETVVAGWTSQASTANRKLKNYLRSGKERDYPAVAAWDAAYSASELDERYAPTGAQLAACLAETQKLLAQQNVDQMQLRVLLAGSLATLYLAEYQVREAFGSDPFLADERFVLLGEGMPSETLVQQGMAALAQQQAAKTIAHDIQLVLMERISADALAPAVPVSLARKGQEIKSLTWSQTIYLPGTATLNLLVDGQKRAVPLSDYGLAQPNGAIPLRKLRIETEGDKILLHVQSQDGAQARIPLI